MRTKLDPDDEFFIPEIDFSRVEWRPNPFARKPGEKTEIHDRMAPSGMRSTG